MTKNRTGIVCKWCLGIIILCLIIGYAVFNSRIFIAGPQIHITSPQNGDTVADYPLISLEGTALHISSIAANDRVFSINSNGSFRESLLLRPGYNIILLVANDKFGRSVEDKIELFYNGKKPAVIEPIAEEEIPIESLENI